MRATINKLAVECSAIATSLTAQSAAPAPILANFRIMIDSEEMLCTNVSVTTWTVTRAQNSTTAAVHTKGSIISEIITAQVGPTGAASTAPGPTGPTGPTGAASTVPGPTGPTGPTGGT
jgi:hypothetical protein